MPNINAGRPIEAMDENNSYINVTVGSTVYGTCETNDATPLEVVAVSGIQPGCYQYTVRCTGHNDSAAGEDVGYLLQGLVSCADDGTMADVGTAQKASFEHAGSTDCDIAIDATTDNVIAFKVTGEAATSYNWSAMVSIFGPING